MSQAASPPRIGAGAYGAVYLTQKYGKHMAMKIEPALVGIQGSSIKECVLLKQINHPGVIKMEEARIKQNCVKMLLPLMKLTLRQLNNIFDDDDISENIFHISYTLVKTLDFLHSCGIHHNDIKPENIMIDDDDDGNMEVKLIDFGLATWGGYRPDAPIVTIMYRPPELFYQYPYQMSDDDFGKIDVWSLGCSLFEFITGEYFAKWDKDETKFHKALFDNCGLDDDFKQKFPKCTFNTCKSRVRELITKHNDDIDDDFIDMLESMLNPNPKYRPTARELLSHAYFSDLLEIPTWKFSGYFEFKCVEPLKDYKFPFNRSNLIRFMRNMGKVSSAIPETVVSAIHIFDMFMEKVIELNMGYMDVYEVAAASFWISSNVFSNCQYHGTVITGLCEDINIDIELDSLVDTQMLILQVLNFDVYRFSLLDFVKQDERYKNSTNKINIVRAMLVLMTTEPTMKLPTKQKLDLIFDSVNGK
jgi:serine/threonine protein kinase